MPGRGAAFRLPSGPSGDAGRDRRVLCGALWFAKPAGVEKPEYFLPELDYYGCVISAGDDQYGLLMPETEAEDYRLRARTPKEFLRHNIILPARGSNSFVRKEPEMQGMNGLRANPFQGRCPFH
jgi:hypothetical protein